MNPIEKSDVALFGNVAWVILDPVGTWPPQMTSQIAQDNGQDIKDRWDSLLTGKWSEFRNQ